MQELFSRDGIGTQIVMESAEQVRRATINDIGGNPELIRVARAAGYSGAPFAEQLEMEIDKFTIIERDNLTIACAALYPFQRKIGEMAPVSRYIPITAVLRAARCCCSGWKPCAADGAEEAVRADHPQHPLVPERGFTPAEVDAADAKAGAV